MSTKIKYPLFGDWFWNANTKQIETDEGVSVGSYTFERPYSTNLGLGFKWVPLNPLNYPTKETADAVLSWVKEVEPFRIWKLAARFPEPPGIVALDPEDIKSSFPQYVVELNDANGNKIEEFSPGLLAFSIMKNGKTWAKQSFAAEVRLAVTNGAF